MRDSKRVNALITAYEKGYRVNAQGQVVSPRGTVRKPIYRTTGYYEFTVRVPGEKYSRGVSHHQLCAYQKYGDDALADGVHVRHLDGDPLNNRPENIAIGDQSDNMMDKAPEARVAQAKRAASKLRKLSDIEVARLRADRAKGMKYADLSAKYGIRKSTISYIVNGKTYESS